MTRRSALQMLATMIAAFGGGTVEGEEQKPNPVLRLMEKQGPVGLYIPLAQWAHIDVEYNGERVRIDPAEMFRALASGR